MLFIRIVGVLHYGTHARSTLSVSDLSLTSMTLLESFSSHKQPIQMGREERLVLIF